MNFLWKPSTKLAEKSKLNEFTKYIGKDFNYDFKKTHLVDMSLWGVGEENALSILHDYLDHKVFRYSKDRNDPIIEGTSRISPYLASGIISSKRCILEALKKNKIN